MKFFRYDSGFWSAMERVFDWMLLNLLWLVTCLPIVTIGASTAALTDVSCRMAHGEESAVFKAWAKHWKTATALWTLLIVAVGWLLLSLRICFIAGSVLLLPVAVVEGSLLFVVVLSIPYALSLFVRSHLGIRETIRQALVAALKHLPWSVVTVEQGSQSAQTTITALSEPSEEGSIQITAMLNSGDWKAGSATVEIKLNAGQYEQCLPATAIQTDSSGMFVYLVEEQSTLLGTQNVLIRLPVTVVAQGDGMVAVSGSISGQVVTGADKPLSEGAWVRVAS